MAKVEIKVAVRYARALFELCPPADLDQLSEALKLLAAAWKENIELRNVLLNPAIKLSQRQEVLQDLAKGVLPASITLQNFVSLVLEAGRVSSLEQIAKEFQKLVDSLKKVLALEVTSAYPVAEEERRQVLERLQSEYGTLASVDWLVDTALIGGLSIRSGDRVLDNSVRGSLEKISKSLVL